MADLFDNFSALFTTDKVFLSGKAFPLGQLTTDILNLEDAVLIEIGRRIDDFMTAVAVLFQKKTDSAAHSAQEKLNAVWGVVFTLPVYRDLRMDMALSYELFLSLFSDKDQWAEALDVTSDGHIMLEKFLNGLEYFTESLRNFRGQITGMLELYFEPLTQRNADAYAAAYADYFSGIDAAGRGLFGLPSFEQSFPAEIQFTPMVQAEENKQRYVLAEKTAFSYLTHFLYTDFYRALMAGNAPRRCHNCGRYFLLTAGYNTCYCNNIAPGETERTCRKVGAHRKEARKRSGAAPERQEYNKAANRLKQRKNRGKISTGEWNTAMAKAQELLEQAEQGKLTEEELRTQLKGL